jgi:hypothetical protein
MISFVNCCETTQKHNGIESCPKCTPGGFDGCQIEQPLHEVTAISDSDRMHRIHKLTFFSVDAAERLKYYLMCSVKKPMKSSIQMHITRMETLDKYLGMLPTTKNSPLAVASTEFGNIPFTEATHASIILSHLPVA